MIKMINPGELFSKKQALIQAEKILREAQNTFGRPRSGTYMQLKALAHEGDDRFTPIVKQLRAKAEEYSDELSAHPYLRVTMPKDKNFIGDCGECAKAVQNCFGVNGTPSANVIMEIVSKEGDRFSSNHMFTLTNISPKMDVANPKTWGKDSVITDLWSGIAKRTNEALGYLQNLFKFNPETQKMRFKLPQDDWNSQIFEFMKTMKK